MARPVGADAEVTRKRILDTARGLFSERGLDGASMRQIASGAGVSLATVHHYFGSKRELYERAIAAMYDELATLRDELMPLLADAPGNVAGSLRQVVARAYRFALRHRAAVRLMMRTVVAEGRTTDDSRREFLMPLLDQGAQLLGPLLGRDPTWVRMALLSVNYTIIRYALGDPDELCEVMGMPEATPDEIYDAVEAHVSQLLAVLLLDEPAPPLGAH